MAKVWIISGIPTLGQYYDRTVKNLYPGTEIQIFWRTYHFEAAVERYRQDPSGVALIIADGTCKDRPEHHPEESVAVCYTQPFVFAKESGIPVIALHSFRLPRHWLFRLRLWRHRKRLRSQEAPAAPVA